VASEVQTIITFLGNWRVIPLTGLGAPLLSLGLSSMASPFIALLISLLLGRLETFGDGGDEL
jgi:cell division protein FtsW (lipid II flippase)